MAEVTCMKCHGAGYIDKWSHINGGQCYTCKGKGYRVLSGQVLEAYQAEYARRRGTSGQVISAAEAKKQGVKAPDPKFGQGRSFYDKGESSAKPMVRSESGKVEAPWGLGDPSRSSASTASSAPKRKEAGDLSDFFDSLR